MQTCIGHWSHTCGHYLSSPVLVKTLGRQMGSNPHIGNTGIGLLKSNWRELGLGKSWIRLLMLNIWAAIPINLMQEQTFKFAFHVDSDTLSSPELTRSVEDDEQKLNKSDQWHSSSWRLEEPHEDTRQCTNAPFSRCLKQTDSNVFSLKEKTLCPIFPIHGSTVSQQMVSEGACSCPASTRWGPRPHLLRKGGEPRKGVHWTARV